ncbi:MAG: V-type ATP synthase subunit D [Bacillota bacterium]|nr:V-type ATP synthase subunit D [Bacillota bacterium]
MMEVRVSPTRMQLLRLKKRLAMAERGHKLLKDKRDELMKRFLDLIKKEQALRGRVEAGLGRALPAFLQARAAMSGEALEEAFMAPKVSCGVDVSTTTIMNVRVPEFTWRGEKASDIYPYGFHGTSASLDDAVAGLAELLPMMAELAEVEKSIELLADEIEKTRRRVNALEYVLIPNLRSTARYITMKLDEMERGNLTRLMKVKDIVRAKQA